MELMTLRVTGLAATLSALLLGGCGADDEQLFRLEQPVVCGMTLTQTWRGDAKTGAFFQQTDATVDGLSQLGLGAVVFNPIGWMDTRKSTRVRPYPGYPDQAHQLRMRADAARARQRGMSVMLKPHVLVATGRWVANLEPAAANGGWAAWFTSYRTFILDQARLAQQLGASHFSVGTELRRAALSQPQRWRRLVRDVRQIYSGQLLYSAHFDSVDQISWWDELDAVGINMFGKLSDADDPSRHELERGARQWLHEYEAVARRFRRPLVLSEVGYANRLGATVDPWEWPDKIKRVTRSAAGDQLQARAYAAILDTFGRSSVVQGIYWWKWFDDPAYFETKVGVGFSPKGLPAQQVLQRACARGE